MDVDGAFDAAGAGSHNDDAVAHVDGLVDSMGDEEMGCEQRSVSLGRTWCAGVTVCFDKWDSRSSSLRNLRLSRFGRKMAGLGGDGLVGVAYGSWEEIVAAFGCDWE